MVDANAVGHHLASFTFKLCADDFGLTPAVTDGILEALSQRRLTATSAMTNRPFWRTAARRFLETSPDAEIGLHLNLTLGQPLTAMPEFAASGFFPSLNSVMRDSTLRRLPRAEIAAEIAAQLDAFEDAIGFPPDFVDGHQHVHGFPQIRQCLVTEFGRRSFAAGFWVRDSSDVLGRIVQRRVEWSKALIVRAMTRGLKPLVQSVGVRMNDGFAGFSAFDSRRYYGDGFAHFLVAPGPRHLVMCHPGQVDEELLRQESWADCRLKERDFLLSDRFEDCLGRADASLAFATRSHRAPAG